jgi:hypothetical protein
VELNTVNYALEAGFSHAHAWISVIQKSTSLTTSPPRDTRGGWQPDSAFRRQCSCPLPSGEGTSLMVVKTLVKKMAGDKANIWCWRETYLTGLFILSSLDSDLRVRPAATTPELTRGNRRSQFHEFTGELTSKVNSHYPSRNQWLQLPNPTARRRI